MKRILPLLAAVLLFAACGRNTHFLKDKSYRAEVQADYAARVEAMHLPQLNLDTLSMAEREAMQFLYAYMPLSDLADYEPQFFLQQIRYAFKAREEMTWGKTVPEDVFRHFVLVYRVNNENLDSARIVMFHQLKDRVNGLSMEMAALEVNHWCHEYVAYRASDGRTSAPLATMRTSLGRCGEESTFTVTAMRAVGIPARQCYTPRWAHCDDNHAWVEVWVDGEWKFLGACEPDPKLDMGWFSIPSTRCMMVHSKAFGKYCGDEEVVRRTGLYSELNLLSHYAPTRRVEVSVRDEAGQPIEGAKVKFKLYNYAEYYTLSTQTTDTLGRASLTTGLGDLLVWACLDGDEPRFSFAKLDVRQDSTLTLILPDESTVPQHPLTFEMVPPVAGQPKVVASADETSANARRLAFEDSVRAAYMATFHSDSGNPFVRKSEGNYAEIERFLEQYPESDAYLATYSDKDMRDITCATLIAHRTQGEGTVYRRGLLPARISNEMVRPYRRELASFRGMDAEQIKQWVIDSITVDDTSNYFGCPISPRGVYRLRHADRHSRDIFYVAACRAAKVPAFLDNATNIIYAFNGQRWQNMSFDRSDDDPTNHVATATLTLTYRGTDPAVPVYWPHFTLAKLEHGDLRTFDFENDARMATFPATLTLEPGIYCLSTGNRYPDGAVRSRLDFFEVVAGAAVSKEIVILPLLASSSVLGHVDPTLELFGGTPLSDYAGSAGMLYINLGDYSEPSKHLIVELRDMQTQMRQWGGMTLMVGPTTIGMTEWNLANTDFAYQKGMLEQRIVEAANIDLGNNYPLVALIDREGNILYHSEGYKIGVVEQVLKSVR